MKNFKFFELDRQLKDLTKELEQLPELMRGEPLEFQTGVIDTLDCRISNLNKVLIELQKQRAED